MSLDGDRCTEARRDSKLILIGMIMYNCARTSTEIMGVAWALAARPARPGSWRS